jgi:hypothetical protein|tara:strand:+ start:1337 stop:1639 length:303 start_codon:yes stop_codon:yes gene_type:complete
MPAPTTDACRAAHHQDQNRGRPVIQTLKFFDRAAVSTDSKFYAQKISVSLQDVAQGAVEAMFKGDLSSIQAVKNNSLAFLNRLSPSRKFTARIAKMLVSK